MDCMDAMRQFPDKFFDLAIVDPPYGSGGVHSQTVSDSAKDLTVTAQIVRGGVRHLTNGLRKGQSPPNWWNVGGEVRKKIIAWDVAPGEDYFKELFRVSRNQIIWGANYFSLPPARCFVIWEKTNVTESFSMAMAEYAWVSTGGNAKIWKGNANGQKDRFHPTQKPVELYAWLLANFAKPGDKILDTHVGSASSLIACHRAGFQYWGFEIDEQYYKLASARLADEKAQVSVLDVLRQNTEQISLIP